MAMKYKELKEFLDSLTEEQLEMDVTVEAECDEFYTVLNCYVTVLDDILDGNHPVLEL